MLIRLQFITDMWWSLSSSGVEQVVLYKFSGGQCVFGEFKELWVTRNPCPPVRHCFYITPKNKLSLSWGFHYRRMHSGTLLQCTESDPTSQNTAWIQGNSRVMANSVEEMEERHFKTGAKNRVICCVFIRDLNTENASWEFGFEGRICWCPIGCMYLDDLCGGEGKSLVSKSEWLSVRRLTHAQSC